MSDDSLNHPTPDSQMGSILIRQSLVMMHKEKLERLVYHAQCLCESITQLETALDKIRLTPEQVAQLDSLTAALMDSQWLSDDLEDLRKRLASSIP